MQNKLIYIIAFCLAVSTIIGQQVTKPENGTFLLKGATVHTITNGNTMADLLIIDGKIADIGTNLSSPGAKVIDCSGSHIYPGLIDGGTQVGMSEVGSVSLTNDYNEIGDFIPHMQALTAVNPNATAIPVTRTNGVTTAIVQPTGGLFPGTAALVNLNGYTPKQMDAGFSAVRIIYPSSGRRGRFDRRSDEDIKKAEENALKNLNDSWEKAVLYAKIDSAGKAGNVSRNDYNPQMEALLPVVRGEMKVMIEVNAKKDILSAIEWVKKNKVDAIFTGVSEGFRVADKIAEAGIPVVTGPVLSIPGRSSDRYDAAYTNPGIMQKAGVKVAIRTNDSENVRNLPFNAGFAAAYGMGIEEALKSVTIVPAEIFGVSDKYGSLEKGKVANLFVSDGDPFETKTTIQHLFIEGWKIGMDNRHTMLYDEFLDRTPGLNK